MSLLSLPHITLGRIGDFLTPEDREHLRTLSGETNVVFDPRPRQSFIFRQKVYMQDLQSGQKSSATTPDTILSQKYYSDEVGTTEEKKNMLKLTSFRFTDQHYGNWFRDLYKPQEDGSAGNALRPLTVLISHDEFLDGYSEDWPKDCAYLLKRLFTNVFLDKSGYDENYSLFTPEEIQFSIAQRLGRDQFPFTLVKSKDINLMDYAFKLKIIGNYRERDMRRIPLLTLQQLSRWTIPDYDDLETVFSRYLMKDIHTSINELRPLFNFRYTHEITIDLYGEHAAPLSFPLEEGGARVAGAKRQRE
jgi:hypothetical protein